MAVKIKPELSPNSKYWLEKHRYYELKYFCLQYPMWKKIYSELDDSNISMSMIENLPTDNTPGDPTAKRAIMKAYYSRNINLIESIVNKADKRLYNYILKAVTEGVPYTQLKSRLEIPCSRDMYYDRYRRFFWLLDKEKN